MNKHCVQLQNLNMSYFEGHERRILNQANAQFPLGQCTALLGPSGCGKSTVLNLIAGLDRPQSGDIFIQDHCMTKMSERAQTRFRREHLGIVFQFFNLLPNLTVLENLALPLQLLRRPKSKHIASEWLTKIGLQGRENSFPDKLSGGEQQRIALARALIHQPELVLADEPTGNLDEKTGQKVIDLMFQWVKEGKQSLILVTHNPELAQKAELIYELQSGQLCPRH